MKTGIILAGGLSRRFGGEKGQALLHGKPLIEWAIAALKPLCSEIIISANSSSYDHYGYPVIPDVIPGKGPMMGIYSALVASTTEDNFVLSVDTPLVIPALLQFIFDHKEDALIAVPQTGSAYFEPLIGYYNRATVLAMETSFAKDNYKLPDLFLTLPFKGINLQDWPLFCPELLSNINTLGELKALQLLPRPADLP